MASLGVNIDHVATVRQARRTVEPDPVWAAALAELGGADAITVHLREDRRHIQDRDLEVLRRTVQVRLNLEAAVAPEMIEIACRVRPDQVTLVPERREEVTTEGGLDVVACRAATAAAAATAATSSPVTERAITRVLRGRPLISRRRSGARLPAMRKYMPTADTKPAAQPAVTVATAAALPPKREAASPKLPAATTTKVAGTRTRTSALTPLRA